MPHQLTTSRRQIVPPIAVPLVSWPLAHRARADEVMLAQLAIMPAVDACAIILTGTDAPRIPQDGQALRDDSLAVMPVLVPGSVHGCHVLLRTGRSTLSVPYGVLSNRSTSGRVRRLGLPTRSLPSGSNRRPAVYETAALPAELERHDGCFCCPSPSSGPARYCPRHRVRAVLSAGGCPHSRGAELGTRTPDGTWVGVY